MGAGSPETLVTVGEQMTVHTLTVDQGRPGVGALDVDPHEPGSLLGAGPTTDWLVERAEAEEIYEDRPENQDDYPGSAKHVGEAIAAGSLRHCDTRSVTGKRGLLLIGLAAALWGTTGTAQALGPATSDPISVGVARLVVASPALLAISYFDRNRGSPASTPWRPALMAGAAMTAYQPLFFTAVKETGVALGTVVTIGSAPVLAGLLGWLLDGESPSRSWWPATVLGLTGIVLIGYSTGELGVVPSGILAAIGAGIAFATYMIASRRIVLAVNPIQGTAVVFTIAAGLSLPLLIWSDLHWISDVDGWLMTLHLGLVATALAYVFFSIGLRSTRVSAAATTSLTEPATATLLGVVILGETPGVLGWSGIILILSGLVVLSTQRG